MPERIEEIRASGNWLMEKLLESGCAETLAKDICFAMGQRYAMFPETDIHDLARNALMNYQGGKWETPGEELAGRLCRERFGDPPHAQRVLEWLEARELVDGGKRDSNAGP